MWLQPRYIMIMQYWLAYVNNKIILFSFFFDYVTLFYMFKRKTMESSKIIVEKKVEDLTPYMTNPKMHPDFQVDLLAESIKEWGFTIPILIDEQNEILAGHGRLYAAIKLGLDKVPCIEAHGWSDEQKKAYIIADNKIAEKGDWDYGLLFSELKQIAETDFNIDLTGMSEEFESMNFSPDTNPETFYSDITDEDLENAQESLGGSINRTNQDVSLRATEVVCPHCSKSFKFEGM